MSGDDIMAEVIFMVVASLVSLCIGWWALWILQIAVRWWRER